MRFQEGICPLQKRSLYQDQNEPLAYLLFFLCVAFLSLSMKTNFRSKLKTNFDCKQKTFSIDWFKTKLNPDLGGFYHLYKS